MNDVAFSLATMYSISPKPSEKRLTPLELYSVQTIEFADEPRSPLTESPTKVQ